MKLKPCNCPIWSFPHRYSRECRELEDELEQWNTQGDEWADERRMDNRERAADINESGRNPWK